MQAKYYEHTHTFKILCHNLNLFIQHLLDVFKEYKPNTLELNCTLFVILSMHSADTACNFSVIPCANMHKESRAAEERQTASHLIRFQCDNAAWRQGGGLSSNVHSDRLCWSKLRESFSPLSSIGGCRRIKQGDGWTTREKESSEETPKKRQICKRRPP